MSAVVTPLGTAAEITSTCITSCETGPAMSSYGQITSQATNGPAIKRTALPHITLRVKKLNGVLAN